MKDRFIPDSDDQRGLRQSRREVKASVRVHSHLNRLLASSDEFNPFFETSNIVIKRSGIN